MSVKIRPNVDGTTSFLNGSDVEVAKLPATQASADKQVATYGDVIGIGQTWQDVTASRALGTTYTNNTGKPIAVSVRFNMQASSSASILAGLYFYVNNSSTTTQTWIHTPTIIVPNGGTYKTQFDVGTASITSWHELR